MSGIKKRMRVFAGPNGSGKSTLFEAFSKNYNTGYFINADNIERELEKSGFIDLEEYNVSASQYDLERFFNSKNAYSLIKKSEEEGHDINLAIKKNCITDLSKKKHTYEGSLVASFLRENLIATNQSFCFETVMSHHSKLEDIKLVKSLGYFTYLYFVCIDDSEVNISRVNNRVDKGGHAVSQSRIIDRYSKTLTNLFPAIEICNKVYLFDNSGEKLQLIAEIEEAKSLKLHVDEAFFPNWFKIYVLKEWMRTSSK